MKRVAIRASGVLAFFLLLALSAMTNSTGFYASPAHANPFTPALQEIASGFFQPVFVTHAGDGSGRLFIVEKGGKIKILASGQVLPTPFIDIGSLINFGYEMGLISMTFHPDFDNPASSGYRRFFIYYTRYNAPTDQIFEDLASYKVSTTDPNQADPTTGQVLLSIPRPADIHGGGFLSFGPDGYLYLATGDGNFQGDPTGNAQNKNLLLGKVLRLDVDHGSPYSAPSTNPFVGQPDVRPEIWALGLRNPWRGSFDRETGDLWIGDVGLGQREEVNFQRASSHGGENYGWALMEGSLCRVTNCNQYELTLPVTEYDHTLGCAVIGGYVYRGGSMPPLRGAYIFGDYCTGRIWSLRQDAFGAWVRTQIMGWHYDIASFGEDEAGELYVIDTFRGRLYRLVDASAPTPTPTLTAIPTATATPGGPTPTATSTPTVTPTPTPGLGSGPDLVITAFSAAPAPSNRPIPVSVTVLNQGNATTGPGEGFDVHVFPDLGRPPVPSDINLVAHLGFPAMSPGASVTVAGEIYPDSLEPGSHILWVLIDAHETERETNEGNNTRSFPVTVYQPGDFQIVTFDDLAGENQPLNGQYPAGVIDWQNGQWYHAGPSGGFATKSVRFAAWWQTNVTFISVAPMRLISLQAYNSGGKDTTIALSCAHQPTKQVVLGAGQLGTIETGWTGTCTRVTVRSSNGPATYFDSLTYDRSGSVAPTATSTPTSMPTPTATSTPTHTATPIPGPPTATPTVTATPPVGPPVAANKLVNPGFEEGLKGWYRPPWFASVADVQSEVVHSGTKAFYFHGKTTGSYVQQEVAATAGKIVTLSGWVNATYKNSAADWHNYGHAHIKLVALNANKGKLHTYPGFDGMSIPPGGWMYVSFTQQLPPGTAYLRLLFDTYGLDGTVYFDDFSLTSSDP